MFKNLLNKNVSSAALRRKGSQKTEQDIWPIGSQFSLLRGFANSRVLESSIRRSSKHIISKNENAKVGKYDFIWQSWKIKLTLTIQKYFIYNFDPAGLLCQNKCFGSIFYFELDFLLIVFLQFHLSVIREHILTQIVALFSTAAFYFQPIP